MTSIIPISINNNIEIFPINNIKYYKKNILIVIQLDYNKVCTIKKCNTILFNNFYRIRLNNIGIIMKQILFIVIIFTKYKIIN